ncbi:hypothetical protein [Agromyces salentinus]|uniref:Uncharacterized protein n=1 Tax=Agromyces salentinus TaxID=269421 RepID=A0ABP4ZBZ6_9MICO|nr:hypothetical protein [Agromyces salentinus]
MMDHARVAAFLAAAEKLPPSAGITFHGMNGPVIEEGTLAGVLATSRSIRVATENFRASSVVVILGRSGRELTALSRHPDEQEVVFLPGTSFLRAAGGAESGGLRVVLLEEVAAQIEEHGSSMPADDLLASVVAHIERERDLQPVDVHSAGKFVGPLPLLE